jgi:ribonucleoside-diphosphate reductase beta chain
MHGLVAVMENMHNETYSLLIDTCIKNKQKHANFFNAIKTMPAISAEAKK